MSATLFNALKEWAVAVEAMLAGQQILLLRKGGIREDKGQFAVQADTVLLFPTFEHQRADLVKPAYQSAIPPLEGPPTDLVIRGWAHITHAIQLQQQSDVLALYPFHIWNERFVAERWAWKPKNPLHLLLMRSHVLSQPVTVPYRPEYGGCRSWISLAEGISIEGSRPVLSDEEYQQQVEEILAAVTLTASSGLTPPQDG